MSLKLRLSKLEKTAPHDPEALIFATHYEGRNDEIESTNLRAFIDFGGGRSLSIEQLQAELQDTFKNRLARLKLLDFQAAELEISKHRAAETGV